MISNSIILLQSDSLVQNFKPSPNHSNSCSLPGRAPWPRRAAFFFLEEHKDHCLQSRYFQLCIEPGMKGYIVSLPTGVSLFSLASARTLNCYSPGKNIPPPDLQKPCLSPCCTNSAQSIKDTQLVFTTPSISK